MPPKVSFAPATATNNNDDDNNTPHHRPRAVTVNNNNKKQPTASSLTFRFSPSSFASWHYFKCPKQQRFALEKKIFGKSNSNNSISNINTTENDTGLILFETIAGKETTGRGDRFEAAIFEDLKKKCQNNNNNTNDKTSPVFVNFDEIIGNDNTSASSPFIASDPTKHFMETILQQQVIDTISSSSSKSSSSNNNDDKNTTKIFYLAQVPLRASPQLEKDLFGDRSVHHEENNNTYNNNHHHQNQNKITFSMMKPDLLILSVHLNPENNKYSISIKIVDVKSSRAIKSSHCMQAACYSLVIKSLILASSSSSLSSSLSSSVISDISVENDGEIWLPSFSASSSSSSWKAQSFSIRQYEPLVDDFIRQTLLPVIVDPPFFGSNHESYHYSYVDSNNNNNNNNNGDIEDTTMTIGNNNNNQHQHDSLPFVPFVEGGMNSTCGGCEFKMQCKKIIAPPPSSGKNKLFISPEETFQRVLDAVPSPLASSSSSPSSTIGGDDRSSSSSSSFTDIARSNITLEYLWKAATKYSIFRRQIISSTSSAKTTEDDDHSNENNNNPSPLLLPLTTTADTQDFKLREEFINMFREMMGYDSNTGKNGNNEQESHRNVFSASYLHNAYLQLSRRNRLITLEPLLHYFNNNNNASHRLIITGVYITLTTKNSASKSSIHRVIVTEREFSSNNNNNNNNRVVFDETTTRSANNQESNEDDETFFTKHIQKQFAQKVLPQHKQRLYVVWDHYSGVLLSEVLMKNASADQEGEGEKYLTIVEENENNNDETFAAAATTSTTTTKKKSSTTVTPKPPNIDFFFPQIIILQEAINSHCCFGAVGVAELNEVAEAFLFFNASSSKNQQQQNATIMTMPRLLPAYSSLHDFGLSSSSSSSSSYAQTVPKLLTDIYCKLYTYADQNNSLRLWPVTRLTNIQNVVVKQKSAVGSNSNSNNNNDQNQYINLSSRLQQFLSFQATGSWIDRGNAANTLFGSSSPNTTSPSFCRIEVKFYLGGEPSSSSSSTGKNSASTTTMNFRLARSNLVDYFAKDCIWGSSVDRMKNAMEMKTRSKKSIMNYCSQDGELDVVRKRDNENENDVDASATTTTTKKKSVFQRKSIGGKWYSVSPSTSSYQSAEELFGLTPFFSNGVKVDSPETSSSAFLSGNYCISICSKSENRFDQYLADERHVFSSKFASVQEPAKTENSSISKFLGFCDVVCVEDLTDDNNTHNNSSNNNRTDKANNIVTLGLYLFFTSSFRLYPDKFYCITPRFVNVNTPKTLKALEALENKIRRNQILQQYTSAVNSENNNNTNNIVVSLLLDAATSPRSLMMSTNQNQQNQLLQQQQLHILNRTAHRIKNDVESFSSTTNKKLNISPEHQRFLDHVENNQTSLLWGPPGSGKTQTLALTILSLCLAPNTTTGNNNNDNSNKNILIIASTHKALQQLHQKLDNLGKMLNSSSFNNNNNSGYDDGDFSSFYGNNKVIVQRIDPSSNNDDNNEDDFGGNDDDEFFNNNNTTPSSPLVSNYYGKFTRSNLRAGQSPIVSSVSLPPGHHQQQRKHRQQQQQQQQEQNDDYDENNDNDVSVLSAASSSTDNDFEEKSENNGDDDDDEDDQDDEDDEPPIQQQQEEHEDIATSTTTISPSAPAAIGDETTPTATTTVAVAKRGRGRPKKGEIVEKKEKRTTRGRPPSLKSSEVVKEKKPRGRPPKQKQGQQSQTAEPEARPPSSIDYNNVNNQTVFSLDSVPTYYSHGSVPALLKSSFSSNGGKTTTRRKSTTTTAASDDNTNNNDGFAFNRECSPAAQYSSNSNSKNKDNATTAATTDPSSSASSETIKINNIVLCTIWAANKLDDEMFDILVVDEASQIQLVDALNASMKLKSTSSSSSSGLNQKKLIVAGDPLQFQPIVSDALSATSSTSNSSCFSSQVWCRNKSADCLRVSAGTTTTASANNKDRFPLATASVFDSLLWKSDHERFTDIASLSSLGKKKKNDDYNITINDNNDNDNEQQQQQQQQHNVIGMYQLPYSFRSTPEIIDLVRFLYPKFSVAPSSNNNNNQQLGASGRSSGVGIYVTILRDSSREAAVVNRRVHQVLSSRATRNDDESDNGNNNTMTQVAVVTPRRHQRSKIRETLLLMNCSSSSHNNNDNDDDGEDEFNNKSINISQQDFASSKIVVDTTEKMQGDQAQAVILAFADVRNTKFALNLRRINVAISRAVRYVELIVHENLLSKKFRGENNVVDNNKNDDDDDKILENELKEYDRQEEEDERMSGRPRSYCLESWKYLKFFVELAAAKQKSHQGGDADEEEAVCYY